jgi:choline kinase
MTNINNNHPHSDITAIILAAGLGSRLEENTESSCKCLVEVAGTSMLSRILEQLSEQSINKVIIAIGYLGHLIEEHVKQHFSHLQIEFVTNADYATTGSIASLSLALQKAEDSKRVLLIEGDVVLKDHALAAMLALNAQVASATLLSKHRPELQGTFALIHDDKLSQWKHESVRDQQFPLHESYKTVNITLFNHEESTEQFKHSIGQTIKQHGTNTPLEYAMDAMIESGITIKPIIIDEFSWFEVDTPEDLVIANDLFSEAIA